MTEVIKEKNIEFNEGKGRYFPILEIPKIWNPIGYEMQYFEFPWYQPKLSEKKLPIENPELKRILERPYSEDQLNLRNTNLERVKDFTLSYLQENPKLLEWADLYNLNPKQAFEIAGKIVAERLQHDYDSIRIKESHWQSREPVKNHIAVPSKIDGRWQYWESDKWGEQFSSSQIRKIAERLQKTQVTPVEDLLAKDRWAICRHYSRTFIAIFDALKSVQKWGGLQNTYAIQVGNARHSFNLWITIEEWKRLNIVTMDPTSADVETQNEYDTKNWKKTKLWFNREMFDAWFFLWKDANIDFF
jgi:hypothetical protein